MELLALASNPSGRTVSADGAEKIINLVQQSKLRFSSMLWNMKSITRHKISYGHPLHPDLTPDVLTCVVPLSTVGSGRESGVDPAHHSITLIKFNSVCHLISQHTRTCIHNFIITHSPSHAQKSCGGEW